MDRKTLIAVGIGIVLGVGGAYMVGSSANAEGGPAFSQTDVVSLTMEPIEFSSCHRSFRMWSDGILEAALVCYDSDLEIWVHDGWDEVIEQ